VITELPRYMIDTNIASYLIKGKSSSAQARMEKFSRGQIIISTITEAELHYGLQNLPDDHILNVRVREFLNFFPPVPWGDGAPEIYASVKRRLERIGTPLEDMDLMIAAHAMSTASVLVTNNARHFERIGGELLIENWHRE
jgi:tRNA(fMet)-specific endonuclease VapC